MVNLSVLLRVQSGKQNQTFYIATENGKVKFYDLKGNRVENPVRGIYVTSEGRKVLVK